MHGNNFPSGNEALPSDTQSFQGLPRLTSYHLHPPPASYQQFEVGQPVSIQQAAPTQSEPTSQPSDRGRAQDGSMQMLLEASDDEEEDDENVEEEEEPDKIKEARAALRAKYEALSANEIRKECTNRELRLKSGMKKGERVDILVRIDLAAKFFGNVVLGDVNGSSKKKKVGARTKHCMYRLLNILFSDEFAVRFSQSGNKAPRSDLDTRTINDRSDFWQDVRAAFVQEYPAGHEVNELFVDHYLFEGITPSVFKPHSAKKLFDMWKDADSSYRLAMGRFTTSGQHDSDFGKYVNGCGYVLYLHERLKVKDGLTNFVIGGLLPGQEVDTGDDNTERRQTALSNTTPSKSKRTAEYMESFAGSFATYVKDRRIEAERASTSASEALEGHASILSMLGDIRRQLAELDAAIVDAGDESLARLEEDRVFLLTQRQSLMEKLSRL